MEEQGKCVELEMEEIHPDRVPNRLQSGTWICCVPCYWLQSNDSVQRTMLTTATLLVSVLLVASPVIFLMSNAPSDKTHLCNPFWDNCGVRKRSDCVEEECVLAGQRLSATMELSTNPCQDVSTFVCGTTNQTPSNSQLTYQHSLNMDIRYQLALATNSPPFHKLNAFFKSCLRVEDQRVSFTSMTALIKELGGYVAPYSVPPCDLTTLLYRLMKFGGTPLIQVGQLDDTSHTAQILPVIDLPRQRTGWSSMVGYEFEIKRTGDPSNEEMVYQRNMLNAKRLVMQEVFKEIIQENITNAEKIMDLNSSLIFNEALYEAQQYSNDHSEESIRALQEKFPFLQWQQLLQLIFRTDISSQQIVQITSLSYLNKLHKVIKQFDNRVIHNSLLVLYATDNLYPMINSSAHDDWPAYCAKFIAEMFEEPVISILAVKYSKLQLQTFHSKVSNMIAGLKEVLKIRLTNTLWIHEELRRETNSILDTLQVSIASIDKYRNNTYITNLMDDVRIDPEDFLGNVIRRYAQLPPKTIGISGKRSRLHKLDLYQRFPIYTHIYNRIDVPLAILLHPSFQDDIPSYMSYSTVGQIISQCLVQIILDYLQTHTINDSAARERLTCITMSNKNSQVTNAVDVAYEAWSRGQNAFNEPGITLPTIKLKTHNNQLFFMLATQAHCSDRYEALQFNQKMLNNVIMKSEHFPEVFQCSNTNINRKEKCRLW